MADAITGDPYYAVRECVLPPGRAAVERCAGRGRSALNYRPPQ